MRDTCQFSHASSIKGGPQTTLYPFLLPLPRSAVFVSNHSCLCHYGHSLAYRFAPSWPLHLIVSNALWGRRESYRYYVVFAPLRTAHLYYALYHYNYFARTPFSMCAFIQRRMRAPLCLALHMCVTYCLLTKINIMFNHTRHIL
jgi:hypothetical protein